MYFQSKNLQVINVNGKERERGDEQESYKGRQQGYPQQGAYRPPPQARFVG